MTPLTATFLTGVGLGAWLALRVAAMLGNGPLAWQNRNTNRALRDLWMREEGYYDGPPVDF